MPDAIVDDAARRLLALLSLSTFKQESLVKIAS